MIIRSIFTKFVSTKILKGHIHGQGTHKTYCFVVIETDQGIFLSELYCGTYNRDIITTCIQTIREKLVDFEYNNLNEIRTRLHIPFISGNGAYQACTNVVLNALDFAEKDKHDDKRNWYGEYYYSGGTVKTKPNEFITEIEYAKTNKFSLYKVRLDYRDTADCLAKIEILNSANISYSVDFIVNTNLNCGYQDQILKILNKMDPEKVCWVEEPMVPTDIFQNLTYVQQIRDMGYKIALGESFTSMFEFSALDRLQIVDLFQLDATQSSSNKELITFATTCSSSIGFHNWGSFFGMMQNMHIAQRTGVHNYFEVPYYATEFDIMLADQFEAAEIHNLNLDPSQFQFIFELIEARSGNFNGDFKWS